MLEQGIVRRNSGGGCGKMTKDQSNHLTPNSLRIFLFWTAGAEKLYQEKANALWIWQHVVLDPILELLMGKIVWLLLVNLLCK